MNIWKQLLPDLRWEPRCDSFAYTESIFVSDGVVFVRFYLLRCHFNRLCCWKWQNPSDATVSYKCLHDSFEVADWLRQGSCQQNACWHKRQVETGCSRAAMLSEFRHWPDEKRKKYRQEDAFQILRMEGAKLIYLNYCKIKNWYIICMLIGSRMN